MVKKLYNSSKIIKAIRENKPKFDILKSIAEKILEVRKEKKEQEKFVEKVYDIILKNLASEKKEVIVIDKNTYYINKSGITKKSGSYGQNSENIKLYGELLPSLVKVRKNILAFLKVLSPKKRGMFKKFMEKVHLLEEEKPMSISYKKDIEWMGYSKKTIEKLNINYSNDDVWVSTGINWQDKISIIHPDFKDYPVIEQLFNQIKYILEKELKQNIKELDNIKKFLTDIDTKFNNYIRSVETLNELKRGA